jgi:hypothetical protein
MSVDLRESVRKIQRAGLDRSTTGHMILDPAFHAEESSHALA